MPIRRAPSLGGGAPGWWGLIWPIHPGKRGSDWIRGGGDFMHAGALDYAMRNYAQLCKIMHDYAGCIATKTHRDCKQEGTWECDPPQTDNTVKSAAAIHAYFGQKINLYSLIFRRWKNFIVRQNIFSSGSMCRCILLDKIVHDKHNNKLHWTRVEQTIMHNYAQLCTCIIPPPLLDRPRVNHNPRPWVPQNTHHLMTGLGCREPLLPNKRG